MDYKFLYKHILNNSFDGIYIVDNQKRIKAWNKCAEKITAYKDIEVIGKKCSENILIHTDEKGQSLCNTGKCPVNISLNERRSIQTKVYFHHKEGHRVAAITRVSPIYKSDGSVSGAIEIFREDSTEDIYITKIKELKKLAMIDYLTSVANRRYTTNTIESRLAELQRYNWQFGVLFIDLDHFKRINDSHGHDIGDSVLKMVANTLLKNLRPFDVIGRWGGEEFVAVIVNVNKGQLDEIAEKFRLLVETSVYSRDSQQINVTISIGGTLAREDDSVDSLVKRADINMFKSKKAGRNITTII